MESMKKNIIIIIGPTASGKSARAVALAKERDGEVISVDSRQVYRTLDIGTEKTSKEEMDGIPHHLIDIREPEEIYSAGDFVEDASRLIEDITARGKVPILCGGTHFYIEALLYGLPAEVKVNPSLRDALEEFSSDDLYEKVKAKDPARAKKMDPQNKRRLIRALEILETVERVPERKHTNSKYEIEWILLNPEKEILKVRIDERLEQTLAKGLIDEVRVVRARVGDARLQELGLEYRIIGEYLRNERSETSLVPSLSNALWQYARRQKQWIRRLRETSN
jgi:tRNA dimethylallyltransferase